MKLRIVVALAMAAGIGGAACAQDGGKIGWLGKGKSDDVKAIMAQAKKDGKGMMMFFTAEG